MRKKIFVLIASLGTGVVLLPLLAAFEAHIINVTAKIENALAVTTDTIDFGTVFPQEHLEQSLVVALSDSFLREERVNDVEYFIRQKPKCAVTTDNGKIMLEFPTATGHMGINQAGEVSIDCGTAPEGMPENAIWGILPSLCEYISKNGEDRNDETLLSFHKPWKIENGKIAWTDTKGRLAKSEQDTVDNWIIDLAVPCFGGHCAQDWADFVHGYNPNADPKEYVQDMKDEHKVFGCDLWIEVTEVSEKVTDPVPTPIPPLTRDLIAHWKFDEKSGLTVFDSSGNNNHGNVINADSNTVWVNGKIDGAINFDGVNDFLSAPHSSSLDVGDPLDSYTISLWFRRNGNPSGDRRIIGKNDGLGLYPFNERIHNDGKASFMVYDGSNVSTITTIKTVTDGEWHHIVGLRDASSDVIRIYVDGVESATPVIDTTVGSLKNPDAIWMNKYETSGTFYYDLHGLDDVRIYKKALTPSEIFELYELGLQSIVQDDFNSYANGSIVGQGGWIDRVNGGNFVVQEAVTQEGAKALYNNAGTDNVVTKTGTSHTDGKQAVHIKTDNRAGWGSYEDGNAQIRILKSHWDSEPMVAVTLKKDGNIAYYDPISGVYSNFTTYNDNEWTLVEIEWRSSDKTARYRINSGTWTDWKTFRGAASFTDFDTVGFDFIAGGTGGVYFDALH